jgi:hypothetical protein
LPCISNAGAPDLRRRWPGRGRRRPSGLVTTRTKGGGGRSRSPRRAWRPPPATGKKRNRPSRDLDSSAALAPGESSASPTNRAGKEGGGARGEGERCWRSARRGCCSATPAPGALPAAFAALPAANTDEVAGSGAGHLVRLLHTGAEAERCEGGAPPVGCRRRLLPVGCRRRRRPVKEDKARRKAEGSGQLQLWTMKKGERRLLISRECTRGGLQPQNADCDAATAGA